MSIEMTTVRLNNNVQMPCIHLGVYQAAQHSKKAVMFALEAGYRAIDCAETYGNEKDVGSAILAFLKTNSELTRQDIWFTTKLRVNMSYETTRLAIKGSMKRTKLGYIDLYLLHTPSGGKEIRLASWKALEDALSEGEVRSIGLQELIDSKPRVVPAVNQIEVHPFNRQIELTSFCEENGIVVQAYSPLVQGRRMKHISIVEISKKYNVSEAQILVRWSIQKNYVPLPKSIRRERIAQNTDIWDFHIEEPDMAILDGLDEGLFTEWDLSSTE